MKVAPGVLVAVVAIVLAAGVGMLPAPLYSQGIDMDAARAREEFQWGVRSFHAARFNDAIVSFNRALAFTPNDLQIREWLGNAYYRAGFTDAALNEWEHVADNGGAGAYLLARKEILQFRRGVAPFLPEQVPLSRSHIIRGTPAGTPAGAAVPLFRRPTAIAAEPRGDVFLVSLGTQEIVRFSPNGRVVARMRGGLQRLDQPFDALWHNGELFVSEFGGNRITVLDRNGNRLRTFGSRGVTAGSLMGPQHMAMDAADSLLYVTEWGNRRVSVFSHDGEFVLSFGRRDRFFPGLERPTGIAVADGTVYVAEQDREGAALMVFDTAGNYLNRIPLPVDIHQSRSSGLGGSIVEGLSWYRHGEVLLVTAGTRVLIFDISMQRVIGEIDDAERLRVSAAAVDANGRILVADIDRNELGFFEEEGILYSGLDVRIERVLTAQFPNVAVQVAVHDRHGTPLVGLRNENFIVSERSLLRPDAEVESAGQFVTAMDLAAVVQPRENPRTRDDISRGVADMVRLLPAGQRFVLFAAGEEPREILRAPATPERFQQVTAATLDEGQDGFARGREPLDRAIRLAAASLIDRGLRRNVVVFGDGTVTDGAFDEQGLQELAAFLHSNGIRLHYVMVVPGAPAAELQFLAEATGGLVRYLWEPEGLAPLVRNFTEHPNGRYWLTYRSESNPDFGRAFLDISVEVELLVRRGRDQLGYFPPLPQ